MKVPPNEDPFHDEIRTYNFPDSRLTTLDISNVAKINCVQGKIRVLCYAKQRHNKDALFLLVDPVNFATQVFGRNPSRLFIDFTDKNPFPPKPFTPI